jgi:1-acyl-sn-glycerol-3-phosphate acyltransferase
MPNHHSSETSAVSAEKTAAVLLATVGELERELHPHQQHLEITLDSNFDRQLGFDSLTRAELQRRLQQTFDISLPQGLLMRSDTPRDLLRELRAEHRRARPLKEQPKIAAPRKTAPAPVNATTLLEVLDWHVERHPDRPHIYLYGDSNEAETITYQALAQGAMTFAAGLEAHGLRPGQTAAIMLPTSVEYLFSFYGVLMAGGIPVPIYPPTRPSQLEDHLRRHSGILRNAEAPILISPPEAQAVARLLRSLVPSLQHVLTPAKLRERAATLAKPVVKADDVAFLQYTSGSTGAPKGVILTHADLLANITIMGKVVQATSSDVFVSWLPLYHDMGLIGAWLGSLYFAVPVALMSPLAFLAEPQRWLWTLHRHGGTLSAGPNFAYERCWRKIPDSELAGLDLGSWRIAFNGAEPVSAATLRGFTERFARYGFSPRTMTPVYGLAEAAVGLAFTPPGRGPLTDRIDRETFAKSGRAVPVDGPQALEFVSSGRPLPGYQLRAVDALGRELPEREEGRLEFQGPSATRGYFHNPAKTRDLFHGHWLDTGDRGYIAGGEVYLTSRVKDMIIRAGRNIYPYEVEEAVSNLDGVRKGGVVVFGATDRHSGTEKVVVLAETKERNQTLLQPLREQVTGTATDLMGVPPDDVVFVPPRTVPKTSSGKIRRAACRELYEKGKLTAGTRAVWWQLTRLSLASARPLWQRTRIAATAYGYAAWALGWFGLLAPITWLLVVLLPTPGLRRRVAKFFAHTFLFVSRLPVQVRGTEHLPTEACLLVSNHASYLDSLVLLAAVPNTFSFVAKGELQNPFMSRIFLRRLNTEFVERFDKLKGVADTQRIIGRMQSGESLLFFPEGTLSRVPGIQPFHMGAFITAAEAQRPVVPVTLRGTRSVLRGDNTWFPRRSEIAVIISEPIHPRGNDWNAAVTLRDLARAEILRNAGEAELSI